MNQQLNAIISDPTGAIRHFDNQKRQTVSSLGGTSALTQFEAFRGNSAFGSTGGAFGNTGSAFAGSAFGKSAFGGGNNPNPTPAFGSTGFQQTPSAFGNMSQMSTNAFGNPSAALGTASAQPAFGTTSGGFSSTPAFGSASAFGAQAPVNGMNSIANNPTFGATSIPGQNSAFGMNAQQPFAAAQPTGHFGSAAAASPAFGIVGQQPATSSDAGPGSEQQAFLAPSFQYKMIPEQEPPLELR